MDIPEVKAEVGSWKGEGLEATEVTRGPTTAELLRLSLGRVESGEDPKVLQGLRMVERTTRVQKILDAIAEVLDAEAAFERPVDTNVAGFVVTDRALDPASLGERIKVHFHEGVHKVIVWYRPEGGQG